MVSIKIKKKKPKKILNLTKKINTKQLQMTLMYKKNYQQTQFNMDKHELTKIKK